PVWHGGLFRKGGAAAEGGQRHGVARCRRRSVLRHRRIPRPGAGELEERHPQCGFGTMLCINSAAPPLRPAGSASCLPHDYLCIHLHRHLSGWNGRGHVSVLYDRNGACHSFPGPRSRRPYRCHRRPGCRVYHPSAPCRAARHRADAADSAVLCQFCHERRCKYRDSIRGRALCGATDRARRGDSGTRIRALGVTAVEHLAAAQRLKQRATSLIADRYAEASILFADMVGFTSRASDTAPDELVKFLNGVFTRLDALVDLHGVEKIKTTGDAYMVVSGVPEPRRDHAEALADLALDMRNALAGLVDPKGRVVPVRIGIASGPVVAGVVGTRKFFYDVWGDAVNTALRMESTGEAGKVQLAPETKELLKDRFDLEERGLIAVPGKG